MVYKIEIDCEPNNIKKIEDKFKELVIDGDKKKIKFRKSYNNYVLVENLIYKDYYDIFTRIIEQLYNSKEISYGRICTF